MRPRHRNSGLLPPTDCDALDLTVTQTQDHSHVSWASLPGAAAFTVTRERPGATAATIASALPGSTTSFEDTVQNTLGQVGLHRPRHRGRLDLLLPLAPGRGTGA